MNTKSHLLVGGLTILMLLLFSTNSLAEWRIDIESKTVNAGETGVTVDFTGYWDLPLKALVVPIVVREIDAGAFWTGHLPSDTTFQGGVPYGVEWKWENLGWASAIQQVRPAIVANNPGDWCCPHVDPCIDISYDGVSPDHFAIGAQGIMDTEPAHPNGRVFMTITFDVTGSGGDFEFDTACFTGPLSDLFITGTDFLDHGPEGLNDAVFNKGIITILSGSCDCTDHGDCNDDGIINPVDVVYLINYALRMVGPAPHSDPACPVINRGDWDCSGQINLVDIIKMINYVYRQPAPGPCDPCDE